VSVDYMGINVRKMRVGECRLSESYSKDFTSG
jgi:hypothetical protein